MKTDYLTDATKQRFIIQLKKDAEWNDILYEGKKNPTLQKSIDQLIMLYRLIKNGDSKT